MSKLKLRITLLMCFSILIIGFIKVSDGIPKFIKDKSNFKIYYSGQPFNLEIESKNYVIYINNKAITKIKENSVAVFNSIGHRGNKIFTGVSNKTLDILVAIKDKANYFISNVEKQIEFIWSSVNNKSKGLIKWFNSR